MFKTQDWPATHLEVVAELSLPYGTTCKMEHQSGEIQTKKECTHDEYIHLPVQTDSAKKKKWATSCILYLERTRFEATRHLKQNWGDVRDNSSWATFPAATFEATLGATFQAIGLEAKIEKPGNFKTVSDAGSVFKI